ncbi:MAG TPA: winged helix DNA-binding protein [Candidatus Saccharimonadales bacterium]|nr:winged helix DNA-binding protein [Candidatus Saccharimonadales bacterium]
MNEEYRHLSKVGALHSGHIPGILIWQVSKLWQYHLNHCLADLKLTNTTVAILANILYFHEEGKQPSQADVAQSAKVDVMTASRAVRSLVQKGYVIRQVKETDTRINTLELTPCGKETAEKAIQRIMSEHKIFFKSLDSSSRWETFARELDELVSSNEHILDKGGSHVQTKQK